MKLIQLIEAMEQVGFEVKLDGKPHKDTCPSFAYAKAKAESLINNGEGDLAEIFHGPVCVGKQTFGKPFEYTDPKLKAKFDGSSSPLSFPGTPKWRKMKKLADADPGSEEWFQTYFSRPYLTRGWTKPED